MMVFFFKQKTAYELRISDWSSDVCSSDLLALGTEQLCLSAALASGGEIEAGRLAVFRLRLDHKVLNLPLMMDAGGQRLDRGFAMRQIGRASCRERVGQYV